MVKPSLTVRDTSPQYVVLGFLYIRPMHGYDLHKFIATELCEIWCIHQNQVYNIIRKLTNDGLIQSTLEAQEKRPDRSLLSLTEEGKNQFEKWLFTPTRGSAKAIRMEFLTRLYFSRNLSEYLPLQLIQEQADSLRRDLETLNSRLAIMTYKSIFNRMGLDLRVRQLSLILEWVESCTYYLSVED